MLARNIEALMLTVSLAAVPPAMPAAAQDEPLGQPAGWAVEESVTLVTVASGSELCLEPDHAAMVIAILPEAQLPLLDARDTWVKVRYGDKVGWVDLEGGRGPGAARPVHVVVTEQPEPLDLGDGWQEGRLGPYKLFSKVDEPGLIDDLDLVASQHARVYAERYGLEVGAELEPASSKPSMRLNGPLAPLRGDGPAPRRADRPVAGSVLLFGGRQAFLEFQRSRGHETSEARIEAYFRSPDTVLMYRGRESRNKLVATLIHELTHLVNWRVLRAAGEAEVPEGGERRISIPPWLGEGMAEDLSLSRLDRKKDRLVAAPLGPGNLRFSRELGVTLLNLEEQIGLGGTAPSLPQLLAMDKEAFFAGDAQLNYLMSALWIRYLLSDADSQLAVGFRGFLSGVAAGGRPDAEELRLYLDRSWNQLSQDFRGWVQIQRVRVGL